MTANQSTTEPCTALTSVQQAEVRRLTEQAHNIISRALAADLTIEIVQLPCEPLAMGNVRHEVRFAPRRTSHQLANEADAVRERAHWLNGALGFGA